MSPRSSADQSSVKAQLGLPGFGWRFDVRFAVPGEQGGSAGAAGGEHPGVELELVANVPVAVERARLTRSRAAMIPGALEEAVAFGAKVVPAFPVADSLRLSLTETLPSQSGGARADQRGVSRNGRMSSSCRAVTETEKNRWSRDPEGRHALRPSRRAPLSVPAIRAQQGPAAPPGGWQRKSTSGRARARIL